MPEMYLIILTGGGDHEVKLVGPETWKWIKCPYPGLAGVYAYKEPVPSDARREMAQLGVDFPETTTVTSGSFENDRAIQCFGQSFTSVLTAVRWAASAQVTIVDEFHGCLY